MNYSLQITHRHLDFNLSIDPHAKSIHKTQSSIDQPPPTKKRKLNHNNGQTFQSTAPVIFELIITFAFKNAQPSTLHNLRLVCKDFHVLTSSISQQRLFQFSPIDLATVALINGLASTERIHRFRYINGIDYGLDGQYFVGSPGNTLESGRAIGMGPPRTQPSEYCCWSINEQTQCLELYRDVGYYQMAAWLIYLINNILDRQYVINGEVESLIVGEYDGIDNTVETDKAWLNKLSMDKDKDIIWVRDRITHQEIRLTNPYSRSNNVADFYEAINDKEWIEEHKDIVDMKKLMDAIPFCYNHDVIKYRVQGVGRIFVPFNARNC